MGHPQSDTICMVRLLWATHAYCTQCAYGCMHLCCGDKQQATITDTRPTQLSTTAHTSCGHRKRAQGGAHCSIPIKNDSSPAMRQQKPKRETLRPHLCCRTRLAQVARQPAPGWSLARCLLLAAAACRCCSCLGSIACWCCSCLGCRVKVGRGGARRT